MPEVSDTSKDCVLRVVKPTEDENEYFQFLATKLAQHPQFWEDRMRTDPARTFGEIFFNPNNFVVDLGPREGVLAFYKVVPGYRAFLYGASWGPKAMRCHEKRRIAGVAALVALDLQVIDGITREDNTHARRAMERSGMRYRGRIPQGLWYNGQATDGVWYEFSREDAGVPPL